MVNLSDSGVNAGPSNMELDQDYRPRVYNGPAGPVGVEDQDYRQGNLGRDVRMKSDPRLPSMGEPNRNMDRRGQGSDGYHAGQGGDGYHGGKDYKRMDEYGDQDDRDVDHRTGASQMRGGHKPKDNWQDYDEGAWDGGDMEYDEDYGEDYAEHDNRGRKRAWEDGPGGPRGRGGRGGGWGRGRANYRMNRGHSNYRGGGRGWGRGEKNRGGHRGGY